MKNAQVWLDKTYPKDGVYEGFFNFSLHMLSDNRGKKREEIKALDIWASEDLSGSLKLEGFENLEEFNCWKNSLTELDLREAPNLKTVNCSSNNLRKLTLGNLKKLHSLDCSNNKLTELDISNCPRLEKLICDGNQLRLNQDDTVRNLQIELERERNTVQNLQIELERERNKTKILTSRLESNSQN